ncbi:MAG: hypothetical protein U0174_07155 [Polyangiaceae bacterium]
MATWSERWCVLSCALALSVMLSSSEARADNTVGGQAQELVQAGLAQFTAGSYAEAAATFRKAYAIEPTPRLAFNIARSYERAGSHAQAITFYELYVYSPSTEPDVLTKALDGIERCKKALADANTKPRAETPKASEGSVSQGSALRSASADARASAWRTEVTTSYIVLGVGAAALAVGGGVAIWANGTASEAKNSRDPVEKPALRDAAQNRAIGADITMAVGLVSSVVGLVWRLSLGHEPSPTTTAVLAASSGIVRF